MTRDPAQAGPAEAEPTRPATHSMLSQPQAQQKDPGAVPTYEGQVRMQRRARISRESLDLHRGTHECLSTMAGRTPHIRGRGCAVTAQLGTSRLRPLTPS